MIHITYKSLLCNTDAMADPYEAASNGNIEIVKLFIENGGNVNKKNVIENITLLYYACRYGHLEIVQFLLNNKADTSIKSMAYCPLYIASRYGHYEIVTALLENGANIDLNDPCTALYVAASYNNIEVVKVLIHNGTNPFIKSMHNHKTAASSRCSTNGANIAQEYIKQYEKLYPLKEWRPWNHFKYPHKYRQAMKTLAIIAKAR